MKTLLLIAILSIGCATVSRWSSTVHKHCSYFPSPVDSFYARQKWHYIIACRQYDCGRRDTFPPLNLVHDERTGNLRHEDVR
jgi:hypothetical protein